MILDRIVERKRVEVNEREMKMPLPRLMPEIERCAAPRSLSAALGGTEDISLIAEIKKGSPSAGVIAENIDPETIATEYEIGGASAISVLTDKDFFYGDISYLSLVRRSVSLPVLRKDFLLDPYQVYESRANGADAVLLIAAILTPRELKDLYDLTRKLGMEALVEVHDESELKTVLDTGAEIIGINNRNLKTFEVKLDTTIDLARKIPNDKIVVSESGIKGYQDILRLKQAGIHAVLVGETLMRAPDRVRAVQELLGRNDSH